LEENMRFSAVCAVALISLAGCNAQRQTGPAIDPVGPTRPEPTAQLPEGSGCSGAITRYRSVMENDLSMGHVNQSVYNQIQGEISEAASACAAGQDAKAVALVRASKSRHGYPGG
jgi:hypothetical protein